jgi:hypothetical protein
MPQRARRVGCGRVPDRNVMATRPREYFSTIDGKDLPIPCTPNVPLEQVCVGPLLGNDIFQLPHVIFVGLDAEADRVEPISEFFEHVESTPACNLQSP